MKLIHPGDYELNEAKKIVKTILSKNRPVFLIYLNPVNINLDMDVFPIIFNLLMARGVKVASHEIYSESSDDLEAYLKIQNAEILLFPLLMHESYPQRFREEFPKILFELDYSVVTCCPYNINLDSYVQFLSNIGFNVKIIQEDNYPGGLIQKLPTPSQEAIKYTNLIPLNKCKLDSIPIDIQLYGEIKKSTCDKQHNEFESYDDDIYKVNTEYQAELTEMLSMLSQMECCWADRVVTKEAIENGLNVYLFIENRFLKGYAAFEERSATHRVTGNKEVIPILGEIYTCVRFRKNGIANKLLDYAIDDLNIDTKKLYVSGPVMPAAQKIIADRVAEFIILEEETVLKSYTKNEIEKMWGIF